MAVPLRMSVPRMTVRSLGPIVLVTAERAYTATLRNWAADEAHRLDALVAAGIFYEPEAARELAWHIAALCEKSGITDASCKKLAASMLDDDRNRREIATARIKHLLRPMIAERKPWGSLMAEAHGLNGSAGFPLAEAKVSEIVRTEVWFALPPAPRGGRPHG